MDLFEITRTCTGNGEHHTEVVYVVASGMVQAINLHAQRWNFDGKVMGARLIEADVTVEDDAEA